jgi:hypothetical protein
MRLTAFAIMALLPIVACNSYQPGDHQVIKDTLSFKNDPIIEKFMLPYNENLYADSNSLIFYYTKPFDTSFLIHMRYFNDEIVGTYYETLPQFHRDLEGYSDDNIKFLFFDGFSFIVDKKIWDSIRNNAKALLSKESPVDSKSCFDCTAYFLAYNTQIRYNNNGNEIYFKHLAEYFKMTIINRVNKIRREKFRVVN